MVRRPTVVNRLIRVVLVLVVLERPAQVPPAPARREAPDDVFR
jgi:hypothetical protein